MSSRNKDGLKLKVLRVQAGVKAIDVCLRLGWSPSRLSMIENGYSRTDEEAVTRIKKAIAALTMRSRAGDSDG